MEQVAEKLQKTTIAEFDAFVAGITDTREFELVDGEIVLMSNPTETHEQIAANIGAPLKLAMDPRGCRTYQGGIRVQATDNSGAHVRTGRTLSSGAVRKTTKPISPIQSSSSKFCLRQRWTTIAAKKLRLYKDLPTVQHIVLAYSDQMRVEHCIRTADGWHLTVLMAPDEKPELDAVDFSIDLDQVYFDLPF